MNTQSTANMQLRFAPLQIKLDDMNPYGHQALFIGGLSRLATATSVKILDRDTIACCHFIGRKIYLIRIGRDLSGWQVLDCTDTVFNGKPEVTDLCDADADGNIIVSHFHRHECSQYQRVGERILFVRDLPFNVGDFVHGVKFYRPDVIAITVVRGPFTGVNFYSLRSMERLLHVPMPVKTQDVAFLSDRSMVVITAAGAPKRQAQALYPTGIHRVNFSLEEQAHEIVAGASFEGCHFDSVVHHEGRLYVTDQGNDCVRILDPVDLGQIGEIRGYDFPHGLDIRHGMIAVTNYGNNTVDIRRL